MIRVQSITHAVPADQPQSVHQIAARLFPAYAVEGGTVQLGGCRLEDRLFVRLEFAEGDTPRTLFVDDQGEEVGAELRAQLGLDATRATRPPRPFAADLDRVVASACRLAAERWPDLAPDPQPRVTAVWCKFAEGVLRFTIGRRSVELPFADWARTLQPPPYLCPLTGTTTFRLAATDDGRIAAAERIERCQDTGRRVLADELITCGATGRRAVAEQIAVCPVTGQRVLRSALVPCGTCQQPVAPSALIDGQCLACRGMQAIGSDDPRMVQIFDEHPNLERWRNWRMAETATVYILTAGRWLKRLLLVIDRQSLELKWMATGHRLSRAWQPVVADQFEIELGG